MSQPLFHSEQLATEWASRICDRLVEIGVSQSEIEETRTIIFAFTRIAANELSQNRSIQLPYTDTPFVVDASHAQQIIDLFLRGVNHSSKKLRDSGLAWEARKVILEALAWKLFNLAKLLVGFMHVPNPAFPGNMTNSPKELQMLMKQSAETLLKEETTGTKGASVPQPWNRN
ncbi:hypothetical protein [Vampirovibrio sp.]|uniref:hypothetical protein n=1 Tax=Vampirovibrio sp. TaxID=2717857 RepID=UPI003593A34B